jgi:hypothetical protein
MPTERRGEAGKGSDEYGRTKHDKKDPVEVQLAKLRNDGTAGKAAENRRATRHRRG